MAHGGGGRLTHQLIEKMFIPEFNNRWLNARHDSAILDIDKTRLAFTTDSYVVQPLFFPGGDIGKLAVCGTLNDLAVAGARPLFLSCGFLIEEGFPIKSLQKVVESMGRQAKATNVSIVTGDCKVVDKGKGDELYINTAGVGVIEHARTVAPSAVQAGDAVIINGDVGRHGMAIMAERENLGFEHSIESDCADVSGIIMTLLEADLDIHCMRDLTRGGMAGALIEIAQTANLHIELDEIAVKISEQVMAACEILGLDPYYVANEGRFVTILPGAQAEYAVSLMQNHALGRSACIIGRVNQDNPGILTMKSSIGTIRILDQLSGSQLPRIC